MLTGLAAARSELAACVDAPVWALVDAELLAALDAAAAVQAQTAAILAHLVREIEGRGMSKGPATASLIRDRLRIGPWAARKLVDLARALDSRPTLDRALGDAVLNVEQATTIVSALGRLADGPEVTTVEVDKAESALVGFAAELDPLSLGRAGDRILEHVAPEIAARAEVAAVARDERRAHRGRGLRLVSRGAGSVELVGAFTVDDAAAINAALDPLCRPVAGDERSPAQRRADALVEVCQLALRSGALPVNGGDRPQVVVTVGYDVLHRELGVGLLDTGERLSPAAVRRLACDALIVPVALGSAGQVLDVGRASRLFTGPLRRALVARDGGCAFPCCDRPARWAEGHHIVGWEAGGSTSLENGVLLCGPHHRLIHHSEWQVRIGPRGRPEFVPPASVDPQQRPRANTYHRRL